MTNGSTDKPKHIPSSRHTLEEVLHSLQDLLRNELQAAGGKPPAPARDERPPQLPTPADVISQLQGSLADLMPSGQAAGPQDVPVGITEDSGVELGTARAPYGPDPSSAAAPAGADPIRPAAGPERTGVGKAIQQQLPFADLPVLQSAPAGGSRQLEPEHRDMPDARGPAVAGSVGEAGRSGETPGLLQVPAGEEPPTESATGEGGSSDQGLEPSAATTAAEDWDDIPVLQNAIDLVPETGAPEIPAPAASGPEAGKPQRTTAAKPPGFDNHRIAVLATARLDLELRRSGGQPLDTTTVARLAQILEEVLAQAAANMDNTFQK